MPVGSCFVCFRSLRLLIILCRFMARTAGLDVGSFSIYSLWWWSFGGYPGFQADSI